MIIHRNFRQNLFFLNADINFKCLKCTTFAFDIALPKHRCLPRMQILFQWIPTLDLLPLLKTAQFFQASKRSSIHCQDGTSKKKSRIATKREMIHSTIFASFPFSRPSFPLIIRFLRTEGHSTLPKGATTKIMRHTTPKEETLKTYCCCCCF